MQEKYMISVRDSVVQDGITVNKMVEVTELVNSINTLENKMKGVDVSVNNLSKMIFALMGGRNYEGGYEKWLQENIQ
jgi:hypothetical protein|tara:strand:+ start:465 stop:695 length:231 start_codon:yes stop_codon:yes gene_type:complete